MVRVHPATIIMEFCQVCTCCPFHKQCPLNEAKCGTQGSVVVVKGEQELRRRLLEMGFTNGAVVEIIRRAPFGDPIECKLRGYLLSLRNEDAKNIILEMKD